MPQQGKVISDIAWAMAVYSPAINMENFNKLALVASISKYLTHIP